MQKFPGKEKHGNPAHVPLSCLAATLRPDPSVLILLGYETVSPLLPHNPAGADKSEGLGGTEEGRRGG